MPEADDAILQPLVALFADQRTTRVAATGSFATHRARAQHVARQPVAPRAVAGRERNYVYDDLPQDAVVSSVYISKQGAITKIKLIFLDVCIKIITVKQSALSLFVFMCVHVCISMCVFSFSLVSDSLSLFSLLHVCLLRA